MMQGCHRMKPQHAGTGVAHHLAHPFPHVLFIAVHGAEAARLFPFSKAAAVQPGVGIVQQGAAFGTQFAVSFLVSAIEADHLSDNMFLLFDAVHNKSANLLGGIKRRQVTKKALKSHDSF